MGNFYANITLRGPEQSQIVELLARTEQTAFISPTVNGFTVVYDRECDTQDPEVIDELAAHLAGALQCPALAVLNHDDDVLWYLLYDHARQVDGYDSCPGYFDDDAPWTPQGGNAQILCDLLGVAAVPTVESILRQPSDEQSVYLFSQDRHRDLAEALGLPAFAVGLGYNYLDRDAGLPGFDLGGFVRLQDGQVVGTNEPARPVNWGTDVLSVATQPSSPTARPELLPASHRAVAGSLVPNAERAIEVAAHHLEAEGRPPPGNARPEAWLLPRERLAVWLVIFATPGAPSAVVYIDPLAGVAIKTQYLGSSK